MDRDLIRDLAALLRDTDLTEIEVEEGGFRVRVSRQPAPVMQAAPQFAAFAPQPMVAAAAPAVAAPAEAPKAVDAAQHPGAVTSPMVGTAYVAPEPGAAAFVKLGDSVQAGQTLLIVEAMKTMNPIPAPKAGKVTQILIQDAQPVEFGEPLMVIE